MSDRVEVYVFGDWRKLPAWITSIENAVASTAVPVGKPGYDETYVVPRSFPLRVTRG